MNIWKLTSKSSRISAAIRTELFVDVCIFYNDRIATKKICIILGRDIFLKNQNKRLDV